MVDNAFFAAHIKDQFENSSTCEKHRKLLDEYYIAKDQREDENVKWLVMECVDPDGVLQKRGDITDDMINGAVKDIKKTWDERIPVPTEKDLENVSKINNIIEGQDSYGHRQWTQKEGIVATWSNGSEMWYLDHMYTEQLKKKTSVSLDANQVVLPVNEKEFLRVHKRIAPLPLYFGSFEAKQRKIVDWDTADNVWLHGQLKRILRNKKDGR
jgi:hypothetical protein